MYFFDDDDKDIYHGHYETDYEFVKRVFSDGYLRPLSFFKPKIDLKEQKSAKIYISNSEDVVLKKAKKAVYQVILEDNSNEKVNIEGYKVPHENGYFDAIVINKLAPRKIYKFQGLNDKLAKRIEVQYGTASYIVVSSSLTKPLSDLITSKDKKHNFVKTPKHEIAYKGEKGYIYRFSCNDANVLINGYTYTPDKDYTAADLKGAYVRFHEGSEGHVVLSRRPANSINKKTTDNRFSIVKSWNYTP